jgi:hypothetical protein
MYSSRTLPEMSFQVKGERTLVKMDRTTQLALATFRTKQPKISVR